MLFALDSLIITNIQGIHDNIRQFNSMVHSSLMNGRDCLSVDSLREVLDIERSEVSRRVFGLWVIVETKVMIANGIDDRYHYVMIDRSEDTHHV